MPTALEAGNLTGLDPSDCPAVVKLSSGEPFDLSPLSFSELWTLQWEQERQFAAMLAASPRGSAERAALFRWAYDTVTTIHGRITSSAAGGVVMGYHHRYATLVRRLLARQGHERTQPPRVFEIGYGSGALLAALDGVQVSGIEVSEAMREQARRRLRGSDRDRLYLGDFLTHDLSAERACDLVFWNDVLEHLVPDDALDFVRRAYELLRPGGYLVTITPNWHMRPSDVTRDFLPPRTTAVGFHLKEYTLRETTALLKQAGFTRIATPLFVTPNHMILAGNGLAALKRYVEPVLELLPYRLACLACRGLGLSCTIAERP